MSITNSGMTLYTNNDNEGGWNGTDGADAYNNAIQGTNSESWQVSKNSTETGTLTKSANMGTAKYFTFYMQSNLAPYYTNLKLNLRTDTSNYEQWTIATSSARKVSGDFHPIVAQFGQGTQTGTLNKSSIGSLQLILNNSSSGNIRSVINNWIDTMHYGSGRTISGTTTSDKLFNESHTYDTTTNDEYDGCSELYKGSLTFQTDITIDTTTGNSYGEVINFAGGYNTNSIYNITITGTSEWKGTTIIGTDNSKVGLDTSSASSFSMTSGGITKGNNILFGSGQSIGGSTFTVCNGVDPNGATLTGVTISDTTEATTGSFKVNVDTEANNCSDMTFKGYASNNRYAIYVAASVTSFTMDNWNFDNSTSYALYWEGTAGTLTISSTNGTNLNLSGCTTAGGTVSISQNVLVEITNVVVGSRVRVDTIDGEGKLSTNLILEEATSSTVSTSVNFAGLDYTAVSIRVRKSSSAPKYLPLNTGGNITSSGMSSQINQQLDKLVDL